MRLIKFLLYDEIIVSQYQLNFSLALKRLFNFPIVVFQARINS